MRTTVRLNDILLKRAKREAAKRGMTLTALIEQGLQIVLRRPPDRKKRPRVKLPVSRASGGLQSGVDLNSSAALLDRMDDID